MFIKHQNTADAGIGTETERRFLIGLNCDWTVKADLEIGAPVSPFNPARPFYPHYHRCSEHMGSSQELGITEGKCATP
jgi:hypothetical protein